MIIQLKRSCDFRQDFPCCSHFLFMNRSGFSMKRVCGMCYLMPKSGEEMERLYSLGYGKIFLRFGLLTRKAPRSEAFFTSTIQIVLGIRYQDAGFSFCSEFDFFRKLLKKFFTVFLSPKVPDFYGFVKSSSSWLGAPEGFTNSLTFCSIIFPKKLSAFGAFYFIRFSTRETADLFVSREPSFLSSV